MRAFLSFGSNVGDRAAHLRAGVAIVAGTDRYRLSRVYQTEPVGGVVQDDFWNLVMELETDDDPWALLERAQAAERQRERTRDVRWGPRTLDVDVLWVDGFTSEDPRLTVPHPRAMERAFVVVPWRELAPELVSPLDLERASGRVVVLDTLEMLQ
ncbi:MAG: 2-amino-4-hydroxy-6-hydroxymethyldihydropteridine diphosphokinase [Actinomycetales bacterium]|nr:2-amino-4-hydroxy-6-hydroxymethyldihydropteridine diphosphokinase [Actinomycetales bacterium]